MVSIRCNREAAAGAVKSLSPLIPYSIGGREFVEHTLNETVAYIKASEPAEGNEEIYFPGELAAKTRKENVEKGIPADEGVWNEVLSL